MATKVNLQQFSPQQLQSLRQGFEAEISTLSQSMGQFRYAMDKYEQGKRAIRAAQDIKENEQMLIPLSNALYIEGILDNVKNGQRTYLIEYGAGFFVQRSAKQATEFYTRKVALIKQKSVKLQQVIDEKRDGLKAIETRMFQVYQASQMAAQQQVKK